MKEKNYVHQGINYRFWNAWDILRTLTDLLVGNTRNRKEIVDLKGGLRLYLFAIDNVNKERGKEKYF